MNRQRHFTTEAIILNVAKSSESNKQFTFISPEIGVQTAIAFGALDNKSRFCSSVSLFVKAKLFLYKSPKSIYYKLEDIADVSSNDIIRNEINFIYLVSFFSEMILASYINPEEYRNYYYLLLYSIELLDGFDIKKTFLFFTTKFFFLSGYNYNLSKCKICNNEYDEYYFDSKDGGLFCSIHSKANKFKVSKEACYLWQSFFDKKFLILKEYQITNKLFNELFPIIINLINNIFEKNIKTINFIKEIF
jgi:DNA repair protein RecO (recombination protein O)